MRIPVGALFVAALILIPAIGRASGGVNLAWDDCLDEGGLSYKTFACNTNSGSRAMWGSFALSDDQSQFVGIDAVIDIQSDSDSLPDWWQLYNSGACRSTSLSASADFTSAPNSSCFDPWSGQASGGVTGYHTYWTTPQVPSATRMASEITVSYAWPSTSPQNLYADTEYYAFILFIGSSKTVGTGACSGCSTAVCITLSELRASQVDGTSEDLTTPISSNTIGWQSSTICGSSSSSSQWGQIRSLLH